MGISYSFRKGIPKFKAVFLAFLVVLILSVAIYGLSLVNPLIIDIFVASPRTPWGVVTSLFTHLEIQHLTLNLTALFGYFAIFITSNIFLSSEEIERRIRFFLLTIFIMSITSNLTWIILRPDINTTGASGLVFASEGAITAFALINSFRLIDIRKHDLKGQKLLLAIYLYNFALFVFLFLYIILAPPLFLNVAPGVNAFVHGIAFYTSLVAIILIFQIFPLIRRKKISINN